MSTGSAEAPLIQVLLDAEALVAAVAARFIEIGREAIAAHGVFRAALAGGSTPRALHAALVRPPHRDALDWHRVRLFLGDERCVAPDDERSNARMVRETLLAPLGLPDTVLCSPEADALDRDAAAEAYQRAIARAFEVTADGPPPRFDWVGLGLGEDAHTASLFPHTKGLEERVRWVIANEGPDPASPRLSFSYPLIGAARHAVFVVSGASKAAALARVHGPVRDFRCWPAQGVAGSGVEWWLDRAAAGETFQAADDRPRSQRT